MKGIADQTLADVGELRLLSDVVLPMARAFDVITNTGDDCAFIELGRETLAVTADVGPRPVIQNLAAYREDWEAAGWLAVVATASDVATAGAKPLFLTNCVDAPPDLPVHTLSKFMQGYFRAMAEFGFRNGGGDLRHGPSLLARVSGVGLVEHGFRIGRGGARPGDDLVVVGPAGSFMAEFLRASALEADRVEQQSFSPSERLRFPRPQVTAMRQLAGLGLVRAASDTSDGLLGAIANVARASRCGFQLNLRPSMLSSEVLDASKYHQVASPWNIFFAWGDWSVAAVVPAGYLAAFDNACRSNDIEWRRLGVATPDSGIVAQFEEDETLFDVTVVRNENFVSRGFNAGITGHLDFILGTPLFQPRGA